MKAFVAVLCLVAYASARTIINSNHASDGGVVNNSNTIHREARDLGSLNQALNTVAGGNRGPQYHTHNHGPTKIISNKNVLHPGSSGSILNNNGIHRRSVDMEVEETREGRRMINNVNEASNGGVVNNRNVIHREARYINNANHASDGGIINNENIHHREARGNTPNSIMLHAMHLAAHTKDKSGHY